MKQTTPLKIFFFSFLKLSNLDGLGRIWVEEEDER